MLVGDSTHFLGPYLSEIGDRITPNFGSTQNLYRRRLVLFQLSSTLLLFGIRAPKMSIWVKFHTFDPF